MKTGSVSQTASRYARVGAYLVVAILVAVYVVLELRPARDPLPFAPGEWVNLRASSAVLLSSDGTGAADHLGYLSTDDMVACSDDGFYMAYTGPLIWSWRDEDHAAIEFELVDVSIGGLVLAPSAKGSGGWSEVSYWACGGTASRRTYAMTRLELTDLWTPPAP